MKKTYISNYDADMSGHSTLQYDTHMSVLYYVNQCGLPIVFLPWVRLSGLPCGFYIEKSTLQLSVVVDNEYSCLVSAAAAIRLPPSIGECLGHFPERCRACFTLPFQSAADVISARGCAG